MASMTTIVNVRLRRAKLCALLIRVAGVLVRLGVPPRLAVRVGNLGLACLRLDGRTARGRYLFRGTRFPGRMEIEE